MTLDEAFEKIDRVVEAAKVQVKEWDRFSTARGHCTVSSIENGIAWLLPDDGSPMFDAVVTGLLHRKKYAITYALQMHWLKYKRIASVADLEVWNIIYSY